MAKINFTSEPREYILKCDQGEPAEAQTKWHIRPLNWKERAEIQDGMIVTEISMLGPKNQQDGNTGRMLHKKGTQSRLAIEKALVKIENLRDSKDELVKYDENTNAKNKEKILDLLPPEWTTEISEEILLMSGLLKEDEKN